MADILCGYTADRDETLVAYLYGDLDEGQRSAFEAHLTTCERCRHELKELQGVRVRLQQWTPAPDSSMPLATVLSRTAASAKGGRWSEWRDIPVWAQAAAALLLLGVSAGVANLQVHYDAGGLTVRTGWQSASAPAPAPGAPRSGDVSQAKATAPWRVDLDALERRLRTEAHAASNAEGTAGNADAQLLRKVRTLLEDSERRQRNELALRIAEVVQEFDTKRGSDLANIRTLRNAQTVTGVEVVRQQQYLDLLRQVSLQK